MPRARKVRSSRSQIWAAPRRPLFLLAFIWAFTVIAWWPLGISLGVPPPLEPAVLWHIHELLFGFAPEAVGGYLLTALPGWSGIAPLRGGGLQALVLLWCLGRLATGFAFDLPLPLLLLANYSYALLLAGILLWHIVLAAALPKLGFVGAVLGLGLCDAVFSGAMVSGRFGAALTLAHLAVMGMTLLIVTIAGRAIQLLPVTGCGKRGAGLRGGRIWPALMGRWPAGWHRCCWPWRGFFLLLAGTIWRMARCLAQVLFCW